MFWASGLSSLLVFATNLFESQQHNLMNESQAWLILQTMLTTINTSFH
jgi:hypothetical protein